MAAMKSTSDCDEPSIFYYDSDYPSEELSVYPENFDDTTIFQGLRYDVSLYREIARRTGGPILELCCGTGRVAIPLAKCGLSVVAVDISPAMLQRFRGNLERQIDEVASRITLHQQDVTKLTLEERSFPLAIIAFNSLLVVGGFAEQELVLRRVAEHLKLGGLLTLDIVNPLRLKIDGDPVPKPFFTRRNTNNGNTYSRFAMHGAFDVDQRQQLYGWYDEVSADSIVRRSFYSMYWRPIFRFEIELMLRNAGLTIDTIHGGHRGEPFTMDSPRMFIEARRAS